MILNFQRFVGSKLPHPTQEEIAAKRARTHGEWWPAFRLKFSVYDVVVNIFLFPWRQGVLSGQNGLSVV